MLRWARTIECTTKRMIGTPRRGCVQRHCVQRHLARRHGLRQDHCSSRGCVMLRTKRIAFVAVLSLAMVGQSIAQDVRPSIGTSSRLGSASTTDAPQALVQGATLEIHPQKTHPEHKTMAEAVVVMVLMAASVFGYTGNCACPHYTAANGSRCGKRSAYDRPNGAKPLCYPTDVTPQMLTAFRTTGVPAAALALNPHQ